MVARLSLRWWYRAFSPAVAALVLASAALGAPPALDKPQSGPCVADNATMRRTHMDLLKHQRDDTMRMGIRTGAHSLKACVNCHASTVSHSVTGSETGFCQGCHSYAAVKLDCFECHSAQRQTPP